MVHACAWSVREIDVDERAREAALGRLRLNFRSCPSRLGVKGDDFAKKRVSVFVRMCSGRGVNRESVVRASVSDGITGLIDKKYSMLFGW